MEKEIEDKKKNFNILSKKAKNYLDNLISYLMNNKNNFEEKIKPSELEFKLETNSDISLTKQLIYKLEINYSSFNKKRDIINNIKIYKEFPNEIEINDEYYSNKGVFQKIILNISPVIKKGIIIDISLFPFSTYNNENKKIEQFQFKKNINIDNKLKLFIYILKIDEKTIEKVDKIIDNLKKISNIWDYIGNIYVIFQLNTNEQQINNLTSNEKINKYFYIDNSNNDKKIYYLFNVAKSYEDNNNIINIFQRKTNNKNDENYYFILDKNNKVIELKNLNSMIDKLYHLLFNLKENKNKNIYFLKQKEIKKKKLEKMKELIYFISNLKNLNYFFDINFYISVIFSISDDLTEIKLKKINSVRVDGEFIKKEHKYLLDLFNCIRKKSCIFNAIEIQTLDIDIDFTNMKCNKCSKMIPNDVYLYYCYLCKKKYCFECVQEQLKNKGIEKYIDRKHNLIFFKTRDKKQFKEIDKSKLGKNKFVEIIDDNDFDNKHNATCCGCQGNFLGTERYICLKCKRGILLGNGFIDYCGKCIEKMCSNNIEEKEKLETKANGTILNSINNKFTRSHKIIVKHSHDEHIYLMLPLQIKHSEDDNPPPYFYF